MKTVYTSDTPEAIAAMAEVPVWQVTLQGTQTIIDTGAMRPVPHRVSARAFKEALIRSALYVQAENLVAASNDPLLQNDWRESGVFLRSNPRLLAAVQALGKTESDLDSLFDLAASLEVY